MTKKKIFFVLAIFIILLTSLFIEKDIIPEGFFHRQALHAYEMEFPHPFTNENIKVKAPLPKDIRKLILKIMRLKLDN